MDYKSFHNEVVSMQHRINDSLDDTSHPQSRELSTLFQQLEDDVQVQKNVQTIRDHLKRIEALVQRLDDAVMSHGDVDTLADWVRDTLQRVR